MSTPIRPGWARVLGVLPTFVGGHLEWHDDGMQFAARIRQFTVGKDTLSIELQPDVWQRTHDPSGSRLGSWQPEKVDPVVGPTRSWILQLRNSLMKPTRSRNRQQITFELLCYTFSMHTPNTAFSRELDAYDPAS